MRRFIFFQSSLLIFSLTYYLPKYSALLRSAQIVHTISVGTKHIVQCKLSLTKLTWLRCSALTVDWYSPCYFLALYLVMAVVCPETSLPSSSMNTSSRRESTYCSRNCSLSWFKRNQLDVLFSALLLGRHEREKYFSIDRQYGRSRGAQSLVKSLRRSWRNYYVPTGDVFCSRGSLQI